MTTLGAESTPARERRLSIQPQAIADAGWPSGRLDLIAEAIDVGRIRLHLATAIGEKVKAKRKQIEEAEESSEALAAFDDKYRRVSLHVSSNNQLVLPTVVAFTLNIPKGERQDVLVEVSNSAIDLISVECAAKRRREITLD